MEFKLQTADFGVGFRSSVAAHGALQPGLMENSGFRSER